MKNNFNTVTPEVEEIRSEIQKAITHSENTWSHWNRVAVLCIQNCLNNLHSSSMISEAYSAMIDCGMTNVASKFKLAVRQCAAVDLRRNPKDGSFKGEKDRDYWNRIETLGDAKKSLIQLEEKGLRSFQKPSDQKNSKSGSEDSSTARNKYQVKTNGIAKMLKEIDDMSDSMNETDKEKLHIYLEQTLAQLETIENTIKHRYDKLMESMQRLRGVSSKPNNNSDSIAEQKRKNELLARREEKRIAREKEEKLVKARKKFMKEKMAAAQAEAEKEFNEKHREAA